METGGRAGVRHRHHHQQAWRIGNCLKRSPRTRNSSFSLKSRKRVARTPMAGPEDVHLPRPTPISHPCITYTRVTLKLLTPSLVFWTLGEIKHSAHSKVKREECTDRNRQKVGQLSPSTETGAVQGWAMVDSWCQLCPFNQAKVLAKRVTELDPTDSRHPSFN